MCVTYEKKNKPVGNWGNKLLVYDIQPVENATSLFSVFSLFQHHGFCQKFSE